jgi:hypothetical protein
VITVAVENLKPGMAVDLENDEYADPFGHSGEEHDPVDGGGRCSHMYFVDQLALVHEVTEEEGGAIIGVDFDCDSVGFPRGHKVQVDETAGRAEGWTC